MQKIRVLLVDDSSVVLNSLQSILRACPDIEVVGEASDGYDAVAKAHNLRPGLVLMDAQMPQMDGVEATRLIKQMLPATRVLFLAVHPTHIDDALAAGADSYLMKDSSRQELLHEIRRLGHALAELGDSIAWKSQAGL